MDIVDFKIFYFFDKIIKTYTFTDNFRKLKQKHFPFHCCDVYEGSLNVN